MEPRFYNRQPFGSWNVNLVFHLRKWNQPLVHCFVKEALKNKTKLNTLEMQVQLCTKLLTCSYIKGTIYLQYILKNHNISQLTCTEWNWVWRENGQNTSPDLLQMLSLAFLCHHSCSTSTLGSIICSGLRKTLREELLPYFPKYFFSFF